MLDPKFFDDIAKKLSEAIPSGVKEMGRDVERNFTALLQSSFAKLNLVTREEFDAQVGVLTRTRIKLDALEKKVAQLEEQLPSKEHDVAGKKAKHKRSE